VTKKELLVLGIFTAFVCAVLLAFLVLAFHLFTRGML